MGAPNTTPNEWLVTGQTVYALNKHGNNRFSAHAQCGFTDEHKRTSDAELRANAHQMAASGALYDALEDAADFIQPFNRAEDLLGKIEAALALARGESQ